MQSTRSQQKPTVRPQYAHPLLNAANYDPKKAWYQLPKPIDPDQPLENATSTQATLQDAVLLRLLPNLAANITGKVESALPGVAVILGGGTALTLKHTDTGRLGPASRNMRDLDFDLEVTNATRFKADGAGNAFDYLEKKTKAITDAVQPVLPPYATPYYPPKVTNNNTLMCNYTGYLELSFHMDSLAPATAASGDAKTAGNAGTYRLLNDASHLAMSLEALESRLKRPDKLWKNLQDPLILAAHLPTAEKQNEAVDKVASIVKTPATKTDLAQNVLKGYLKLDGNNEIADIQEVKTADGRMLWPATMFGYQEKGKSISMMNDYWYPQGRNWRFYKYVAPEYQQHYHDDFKNGYKAIINTVVNDLENTAGTEKRTTKDAWPRFLPKLKF